MGQHDRSYRHFFTHPRLVSALVRDILGPRATGPVDVATLERVHDSYVSSRHAARQGDLVWRLRRMDGRWLYLLVEFQARPDAFMAVRALTYSGLLWEDLIRRGDLPSPDRIPDILTVVVYHGARTWGAAREIAELIDGHPSRSGARLRYRLVDQRRYSSRRLWRLRGPIAALFLLERPFAPADLGAAVGLLSESLTAPEDAELRRAFVVWLRRVLLPGQNLTDEEVPALVDLEEFRSMLEDNVRRWQQQWLAEGRKEGRGEAETELLLRLLEVKFGPADEATRLRVQKASSARRKTWAARILTASHLAEVFAPQTRRHAG